MYSVLITRPIMTTGRTSYWLYRVFRQAVWRDGVVVRGILDEGARTFESFAGNIIRAGLARHPQRIEAQQ